MGGAQPKQFRPAEVAPELIQKARGECSKMAVLTARGAQAQPRWESRPPQGRAAVHLVARQPTYFLPLCLFPTADAHRMFMPWEPILTAANRTQACQRLRATTSYELQHPMPPSCSLTARKFPADTAAGMLRLFASTCPAADATPPATMTEGEAAANTDLFLFRGRACALARQQKLV